MKIFFAKGLWALPLFGCALLAVFLFIMLVSRCCDRIERAKYEEQLRRAHRYRSF